MADLYTENFGFRKPSIGQENWADEFWQNQDIKDVVLKNVINTSYVVSGLSITPTLGLSLTYSEGTVIINGTLYSLVAGGLTVDSGESEDYLTPVYVFVNSSGIVSHSQTLPTGEFALLGILNVSVSQIVKVYDGRKYGKSEVGISDFYINPLTGNDFKSGTLSDPWKTIEGAITNLKLMNFSPSVDEIVIHLAQGHYILTQQIKLEGSDITKSIKIVGEDISPDVPENIAKYIIENSGSSSSIFYCLNRPYNLSIFGVRLIGKTGTNFSGYGINCTNSFVTTKNIQYYNLYSAIGCGRKGLVVSDSYDYYSSCDNIVTCANVGIGSTVNILPFLFAINIGNGLVYASDYSYVTLGIKSTGSYSVKSYVGSPHPVIFYANNNSYINVNGCCYTGTLSGTVENFAKSYGRSNIYLRNCKVTGLTCSINHATSDKGSFIDVPSVSNTGFSTFSPAINTVGNSNSYISNT